MIDGDFVVFEKGIYIFTLMFLGLLELKHPTCRSDGEVGSSHLCIGSTEFLQLDSKQHFDNKPEAKDKKKQTSRSRKKKMKAN